MVKTNIKLNFLVKSDWIWQCVDDPAYLNCSISIEFKRGQTIDFTS